MKEGAVLKTVLRDVFTEKRYLSREPREAEIWGKVPQDTSVSMWTESIGSSGNLLCAWYYAECFER